MVNYEKITIHNDIGHIKAKLRNMRNKDQIEGKTQDHVLLLLDDILMMLPLNPEEYALDMVTPVENWL